jgi:predicted DNA-binding protein
MKKGGRSVTITFPLQPQEEARLVAAALAKGVSPDALVREALEKILAEVPDVSPGKEPTRSLRGILAKYSPAPSAAEIDENRAEMFANFPRSDY